MGKKTNTSIKQQRISVKLTYNTIINRTRNTKHLKNASSV